MDEPRVLARAQSPRGEVVLRRIRRDGRPVIELRVNGVFVMDDLETTSERALASQSLARCGSPRRVLIGGLGLGFTLEELLTDKRVERVTVVEIEPAVAGWMADGTVHHGPPLLADPRVEVVIDDVAVVISSSGSAAYDLILLDVDNGPAYLVHESNAGLYRAEFLARCGDLLAPGGLLVIWSMTREDALLRDLASFASDAQAVPCAVRLGGDAGREETYWLHLAQA